MHLIDQLELTLTTLLVASAIPFLYFGYHAKYWYRPDVIRNLDFLLQVLAIFGAIILVLKMGRTYRAGIVHTQLVLVHLAPFVLTLLLVSSKRGGGGGALGASGGKSGDGETYKPIPLNRSVEQLTWDDLIIEDDLKQELQSVIDLLSDPRQATKYGIDVPKGILFEGPPGTGKTTIAKVIANTAKLSFFALKMDEVVSKWVGESEKNLTALFHAAQRHAPTVIFIDEVDSIGKQRSGGSGAQWAENLLNHLLQLIDGVVKAEGLYIIAATNRADLVDSALKRAGRLNKTIEIPLPDFEARVKLFHLYLSKLQLGDNVDIHGLAAVTEGKSGADIKEICNQAGLNAFKRETGKKKRDYVVSAADLELALAEFIL